MKHWIHACTRATIAQWLEPARYSDAADSQSPAEHGPRIHRFLRQQKTMPPRRLVRNIEAPRSVTKINALLTRYTTSTFFILFVYYCFLFITYRERAWGCGHFPRAASNERCDACLFGDYLRLSHIEILKWPLNLHRLGDDLRDITYIWRWTK